jgi:hypothetical protein
MAFGSIIGLLQRQLQGEAADGWKLSCIPRVFEPRSKATDVADGEANGSAETSSAPQHVFPTINIPSPVNPGPKPLFPEIFFSLYADQEIESVPPTSNIAASTSSTSTAMQPPKFLPRWTTSGLLASSLVARPLSTSYATSLLTPRLGSLKTSLSMLSSHRSVVSRPPSTDSSTITHSSQSCARFHQPL